MLSSKRFHLKSVLNRPEGFATDRSKAVALVLSLFCVHLWLLPWGVLCWVLSCSLFSCCFPVLFSIVIIWIGEERAGFSSMTKPTIWHVRPAKTQISLGIRMKKHWVLIYPLSAQRRLWSDWADAQVDLSLRCAHISFCWFCHETAHLYVCPAGVTFFLSFSFPLGVGGRLRIVIAASLDFSFNFFTTCRSAFLKSYSKMAHRLRFRDVLTSLFWGQNTDLFTFLLERLCTPMSRLMTKPTKWLCAQQRLRSA